MCVWVFAVDLFNIHILTSLYTGVKLPVSCNWELTERKMGGVLNWLKRSSWRESGPRAFLLGIRGERLLWFESVWNECLLCLQESNHLPLLMWKLIHPLNIKATPFLKYPLKCQSHCALRIRQSAGTFSTSLQGRKKISTYYWGLIIEFGGVLFSHPIQSYVKCHRGKMVNHWIFWMQNWFNCV